MNLYYYCVVKTKLIKVSDADIEYLKPDLPFLIYSYYAVSEGVDLTYSQDLGNEGKEIMACIAVKRVDEGNVRAFAGYLGDDFDIVKKSPDYAIHYPYTIADMKRTRNEETGDLIEYQGADAMDEARFSMWIKED